MLDNNKSSYIRKSNSRWYESCFFNASVLRFQNPKCRMICVHTLKNELRAFDLGLFQVAI